MGFNFSNPPRRHKAVSKEMRAQIEAALSAGMARTIPQGETSHPGYVWSHTENRIVCRKPLIKDPDLASRKRTLTNVIAVMNAKRAQNAAERRARAASLQSTGLTIEQIAVEMDASPGAIRKILYLHKREGAK